MATDGDTATGHSYTIQGVQVQFPYRAYASQLSMMDKILQGLRNGQHCLLESPTGSGKSLALLCAALAWLQSEKDSIRDEDSFEFTCVPDRDASDAAYSTTTAAATATATATIAPDSGVSFTSPVTPKRPPKLDFNNDDDDDFESPPKSKNLQNKLETPKKISSNPNSSCNPPSCCSGTKVMTEKNQQQRRRVSPKIYFGTRTHKQIAQIIRELDKTEYRSIKMSILGSRDYTCVHPKVSKESNKNELCQELLDSLDEGCAYFNKVSKMRSAPAAVNPGLKVPWDLEDMISYGKENRVCPYFLTRFLKDSADIVFCPYNYIIDPLIRECMDISLKNNVLILDEAHNMEDSARSAASFSVSTVQLKAAMNDLEKLAMLGILVSSCNTLAAKLSQLLVWLDKESRELYNSSKTWTGVDFVAVLRVVGWGPEDYTGVSELIRSVRETDPDPRKKEKDPQVHAATLNVLSGLSLILGYIYADNFVHIDDYRIVVTKAFSNENRKEFESAWKSRRLSSNVVITLNFWCLNPAIAFSDIGQDVRSIILTSGTLSPLISFESELNIQFKIKLEANHVINNSQVWVGTIGNSDGCNLNGCFRNTETFPYQDEIGKLVHRICEVTPHGVLCFFPSYSVLDKLTVRWQETGLWCQLESVKVVLSEPRSSVKKEFDDVIQAFYSAVEASVKSSGERGAIFFAVCRGKASEGLDFADDNARAVITVGIPFPNIKSVEINLKRDYNNAHFRKRNLLSGAEWYEIQAFRALNQALGRCIRHRNDWGALIMIDDRLSNRNKYTNSLSKWVRTKVKTFLNANSAISSLTTFMNQRKTKPEQNDADKSINQVNKENLKAVIKKEHDFVDRTQKVLSDFGVLPKVADSKKKDDDSPVLGDATKRFIFKRQSVKVEHELELALKVESDVTKERCSSPLLFESESVANMEEPTSPVITSNTKRLPNNADESCRKKLKLEDCVEIENENDKKFSVFCKNCGLFITKDIAGENFSPRGPAVLNKLDTSNIGSNNSSVIVTGNTINALSPKDTSGNLLNAIYDEKDGCCFQILICNSCSESVGLKALMTNRVSIYSSGEIWFVPSAVRIQEI